MLLYKKLLLMTFGTTLVDNAITSDIHKQKGFSHSLHRVTTELNNCTKKSPCWEVSVYTDDTFLLWNPNFKSIVSPFVCHVSGQPRLDGFT